MNTAECPSQMPRLYSLLMIIFVAPFFFVLGFGAKNKQEAAPQEAKVIIISSKESAEVPTKSGETVFIYADTYTIYRNDAICKIENAQGEEIHFTSLNNQKTVSYEGLKMTEFVPIASFNAPGGTVQVYCDTKDDVSGEFLVGEQIFVPTISLLMLLFFALGIIVLAVAFGMVIENIYVRKKWFDDNVEI